MKFNCLVVEDEPPAQKVLKKYIGDLSNLNLIMVCNNALDAIEELGKHQIHILFLDIQLPKLTGVNFLKSLKDPPQTIFTTAYSEYAVEGFELDAVDYLLKPFSFERFLMAVNKAIVRIERQPRLIKNEKKSAAELNDSESDFVFFKSDKKIYRIDLDELLYIEAVKDYVKIVTSNGSHLILQTLKHWERILPGQIFQRAHKSFIVNLKKIDNISGNIIKLGDKEIPIGRHYREDLLREIEKRFIN